MSELKEMMENTKYAVEHDKRYEGFTIMDKPTPFKNLFKNEDLDVVQLHTAARVDNTNFIIGFCGCFEWKNNEIRPLDHDSYSSNTTVYAYSRFSTNHNKSLNAIDIIVGNDW
jgi:hypothetical protein